VKTIAIKAEWASLSLAEDDSPIVCMKYNGTARCVRFESLEQLKQAIDRKKVSTKKWAIAIPRSSCILKPLTLPASNSAEALTMIEFELPYIIPLPIEEIAYGITLLSKQDNMLNVLVCILKLNTLNEYLKPYRAIRIEPRMITLDSLAIQNWFNNANTFKPEAVISALIKKRQFVVQTCIEGNLQEANTFPLSDQDGTISTYEIAQEMLHQSESLAPSLGKTSVFLLSGVEKYVSEVKNLLCTTKRDPTVPNRVSVVPNPNILNYNSDIKTEDYDGEFSCEAIINTGLLDLAANSKLPHSNLLPQQYLKRYEQKALFLKYMFMGTLVLVLVLLVWLNLMTVNWRIERMSRMIESQIAPIEHIASAVDSKHQRVRAIQGQLSNRGRITAIIDELYRYTPKAISISELNFVSKHSGVSIDIKGQADALSTAFDYTDAVSEAELLNELRIKDAQQIPKPGGSIAVFKAHCDIRNK